MQMQNVEVINVTFQQGQTLDVILAGLAKLNVKDGDAVVLGGTLTLAKEKKA